MSALAELQRAFAAALKDGRGDAVPDGLDATSARRFRVYRNNVHHGLGEALGAAYPVVRALVGDAFFRATARAFLAAHPQRARSLALMGAEFARFLDGFAPAASLPYLADVARLERAVLEALHAADAPPLDAASLAAGGTAWVVHPATRLVASRYPIVAIWCAHQPSGAAKRPIVGRAETALVTRPQERVLVQHLEPATAAFVATLLAGADESAASAAAIVHDAAFEAVAGWMPLLAAGALCAADPPSNISET